MCTMSYLMHNMQKWPLCSLPTMQAHQGLRCPLTESMGTIVYVDRQKMHRSECTHAHADLDHTLSAYCIRAFFHALHIQ